MAVEGVSTYKDRGYTISSDPYKKKESSSKKNSSSYNVEKGVYTSSKGESFSVAPEKVNVLSKQVEPKTVNQTYITKSKSSSSGKSSSSIQEKSGGITTSQVLSQDIQRRTSTSEVKPGQAFYVNIDDVGSQAQVYTKQGETFKTIGLSVDTTKMSEQAKISDVAQRQEIQDVSKQNKGSFVSRSKFFGAPERVLQKGITKVESILPSEQRIGEFVSPILGKDEGIAFTEVVSRKEAISGGLYLVPILGSTRFGINAASLGELSLSKSGREDIKSDPFGFGFEAGATAGIIAAPYVVRGAKSLLVDKSLKQVGDVKGINIRTFNPDETITDVSRSNIQYKYGKNIFDVNVGSSSFLSRDIIGKSESFLVSERGTSVVFRGEKSLSRGEFKSVGSVLTEEGVSVGRSDYLFRNVLRDKKPVFYQGKVSSLSESVLFEKGISSESDVVLGFVSESKGFRSGLVDLNNIGFKSNVKYKNLFVEKGISSKIGSVSERTKTIYDFDTGKVTLPSGPKDISVYEGIVIPKPSGKVKNKNYFFVFDSKLRGSGFKKGELDYWSNRNFKETVSGSSSLFSQQNLNVVSDVSSSRIIGRSAVKSTIRGDLFSKKNIVSDISLLSKKRSVSSLNFGVSSNVVSDSKSINLSKNYFGVISKSLSKSKFNSNSDVLSRTDSISKSDVLSKSLSGSQSVSKLKLDVININDLKISSKLVSRSGRVISSRVPVKNKFYTPFVFFPPTKKKTFVSKKRSIIKFGKIGVKEQKLFILPDLSSVSRTELSLGAGSRYTLPKATREVQNLKLSAIRGTSIGFIPTEQIRTGKIRFGGK